jgi:hypothetical protein
MIVNVVGVRDMLFIRATNKALTLCGGTNQPSYKVLAILFISIVFSSIHVNTRYCC